MKRTAAILACACTALAAFPLVATAQFVSDASICERSDVTDIGQLQDHFASLNWSRTTGRQDAHDLRLAVIFLGNTQSTKPETGQPFLRDTRALRAQTAREDLVSKLSKVSVALGENSIGNRVCLVASDISLMPELVRDYPDAREVEDGPRVWFHYNVPEITISASEFPAEMRPEIELPGGAIYAATYRLNGRADQ